VKKRFFIGLLIIVLIFGLIIIGCRNNSKNEEIEIWSNLTSFSQLEGTWKPLSNISYRTQEIFSEYWNYYSMTFNAIEKTMTTSGIYTVRYAGGDIETWETWKQIWQNSTPYYVTLSVNEIEYSITNEYNNFIEILTDEDIIKIMNNYKINQNGTKLKEIVDEIEIIYTM
jgi:hypothetical protein